MEGRERRRGERRQSRREENRQGYLFSVIGYSLASCFRLFLSYLFVFLFFLVFLFLYCRARCWLALDVSGQKKNGMGWWWLFSFFLVVDNSVELSIILRLV